MNQENKNFFVGNKNKSIIFICVILIVTAAVFGFLIWREKQKTFKNEKNIEQQLNLGQTENPANLSGDGAVVNNKTQEQQESLAKTVSLGFGDYKKAIKTNEEFSLNAVIDPKGKKITAAELHISFDPKALSLKSAKPSDIFSNELTKANIDNKNGTASMVFAVPLGKPAATDVSIIAIFDFQVISSSGDMKVSFSKDTRIAAVGFEDSSTIDDMTEADITLQKQ